METKRESPVAVVAALVALAAWVTQLFLLKVRFFDPDEFQHAHHAWYLSLGRVPYRDFVDHHTPLYHALFSLFFAGHNPAWSAVEGEAMLFTGRRLSWVLTGIILVLTYQFARRWRGVTVAWVTTAFLATLIMFSRKTLEIRPDLVTMIFWLGALIFILAGIRNDNANRQKSMLRFAASGACIALGLMTSQKLLFAGPGLAATMLWFLVDSRSHLSRQSRVRLVLAQVAGFVIPLLIAFAIFASLDALQAFLHYNLGANAGLTDRFSPISRIKLLMRENPFHMGLALAGVVHLLSRVRRDDSVRHADYMIVLNLVGLALGLFINPVPYEQSFLTLLPLLALVAAYMVVTVVRELFAPASDPAERRRAATMVGVSVLLIAFCVRYSTPVIARYGVLIPASGLLMVAVCALAYHRRLPAVAVASVVAFLAVMPLAELRTMFGATNRAQLASLEAVYGNSAPTDTFLDGFTGLGVFRPHASRFWFLHGEMQAMMTPAEKGEIVSAMASGRIAPKLVGYDRSLKLLSPELNQYIEANYRQLAGPLYIRRQ